MESVEEEQERTGVIQVRLQDTIGMFQPIHSSEYCQLAGGRLNDVPTNGRNRSSSLS